MAKPKKPPRPFIDKEPIEKSGGELWSTPSPPSPSPYSPRKDIEMGEVGEIED